MKLSLEVWPNNPYGERPVVGPVTNTWGDKPIKWCVEKVASYGYKGIDFIFDKFLEFSEEEYKQTSETLGDLVASKGLEIPSIAAHTLSITPRKWEREAGIKTFKKAIDLASKTGAKTVVSFIRGGYYNPPTYVVLPWKRAWSTCVSVVKDCAKYARDKGIDISIEPHQGSIINSPESALDLLKEVNMDNVYLTCDFGSFIIAIRPKISIKEAIKKLGNKINHVHAKDITGVIGSWNMCWYGGGMVNFEEFAQALRSVNYDDYICVEWEGWFRGGLFGHGEPSAVGLADFDRVAMEAKSFLEKYFK